VTLRQLRQRLEALGGLLPPLPADADLDDAPITDERWQEMLDLEAKLVALGPLEGEDENSRMARDILRWMPLLRAARQAEAGGDEPLDLVHAIDVKAELAAEDEPPTREAFDNVQPELKGSSR